MIKLGVRKQIIASAYIHWMMHQTCYAEVISIKAAFSFLFFVGKTILCCFKLSISVIILSWKSTSYHCEAFLKTASWELFIVQQWCSFLKIEDRETNPPLYWFTYRERTDRLEVSRGFLVVNVFYWRQISIPTSILLIWQLYETIYLKITYLTFRKAGSHFNPLKCQIRSIEN
jgi:hypothetical protein